MPWDCKSCNEHIAEDSVRECPVCGEEKLAWTMAANKTRTFQVPGKRGAQYLFGQGRDPQPVDKPDYPGVELLEAERVVAEYDEASNSIKVTEIGNYIRFYLSPEMLTLGGLWPLLKA